MKKELLLFSSAPLHSLSLKSSKELFSRAFDISLCDDDDEMRDYVETFERIFFLGFGIFWSVFFVLKRWRLVVLNAFFSNIRRPLCKRANKEEHETSYLKKKFFRNARE